MKTISAFTTMHPAGYEEYGYKNITSFLEHWPKEINYFVYAENFKFKSGDRIKCINVSDELPDLMSFKERNKNNPRAHGKKRSMNDPSTFIYDFYRFSHKSYVQFHAIKNLTTDWIIWLDADSITHTKIPLDFIKSLCPDNNLVSYLGRDELYTETGFICFNRRHPKILKYVEWAKEIYDNDLVFNIPYFNKGYTDCHVFDYTIDRMVKDYDIKINNLTPWKNDKHPFINGPLGEYMDHLKGPRKSKGKSSNLDLKNENYRNIKYWSENERS